VKKVYPRSGIREQFGATSEDGRHPIGIVRPLYWTTNVKSAAWETTPSLVAAVTTTV
jgi:hypothetical protein